MTLYISSSSSPLIKHWAQLQKKKSYREETKRVLVEGKNLVLDLIKTFAPHHLILTEESAIHFTHVKTPITIITSSLASKISAVQTPEGCFAEFDLPSFSFPQKITKALILDTLQDPGNIGTVLRTALAFNVQTVFLIQPSCDPWNAKVIRAAKGAQFYLKIISCSWDDIPTSVPLYVADTSGVDFSHILPTESWFLVLGNEAHGPQVPSTFNTSSITIPMSNCVESLNVAQAGAILLYHLSSR